MPITVDEVPGLVSQAFKLKSQVEAVVKALQTTPSPLTGVGICSALGIPAGTPLYALAETVDLVVKDIKT